MAQRMTHGQPHHSPYHDAEHEPKGQVGIVDKLLYPPHRQWLSFSEHFPTRSTVCLRIYVLSSKQSNEVFF